MASTSSSTSNPNQTRTSTYDVFLSFRGEDTRYTFTDHLYKALVRAELHTFRDDDEIDRGQELKPEIEKAIIESKASIVVLSPEYADSSWCLNELCLILKQRKEWGHLVIPVFYHVDPSHVRHHKKSYDMQWTKGTEDDVKRWKDALTDVANLKGDVLHLSSQTYETYFIDKVVETVICQLDLKHIISIPDQLIGMETRIKDINSLLESEQYNAIAIYGMGGIGKTTLAQWIYNLNKHGFQRSSFVKNIGENYKQGLLFKLQEELLKDISRNEKIKISNALEGTSKIAKILKSKKVLIVLDDIDNQDELNTLLGTKVFHSESKIIITTRDKLIDTWFASTSISSRCKVHELNSLTDEESLRLFSWHAFPSRTLIRGFEDIANQLANYCGGNPLALRVLGSSLCFSDEDLHKKEDFIKSWTNKLNSLNLSKGDLDSQIQEVLKKSFDSLPLERHRELFLHIACFFVGELEEHAISILQDDLYEKHDTMVLVNKCLLTISHSGHFVMHQLVQEMGRTVVCGEDKDPAKRSRVWSDKEAYHVLEKRNGSDKIEGLSLDIRKVKQMDKETMALRTSSLAKMDKLKLLKLKYVELTGSYANFPKLRWLCWHGCPLKKICPGLLKNNLVIIDMSYGKMETFEVHTVLNSLKILNLNKCYKLVSIKSLSRVPKLEELLLSQCRKLTHLCKSIGDLESLSILDLKGCIGVLKGLSNTSTINCFNAKLLQIDEGNSEQPLLPLPVSLKFLYLNNCQIKHESDAQVALTATSFFNVCLERNPFEFLPNNIDLKMLRTLDLNSCSNLKSLPCIPSTLEELYVDCCFSLEKITFQSCRFSLQKFSYEGCLALCEVQGFFKLVPVAKIDEADLFQHIQWIKKYQQNMVGLTDDEITRGIPRPIQMLYEYGIMSTYLQGIKDQSMLTFKSTSPSNHLSFYVPSDHENNKIKGLHISCIYRSSKSKDEEMRQLLAKVSNKTKGLTWVYNPLVYCKPCADDDVLWLTYWPIGNILDVGDEVHVNIIVDEAVIVSEFGASLVNMDGIVEKEEICENSNMKAEEMIGGDLSEFEVTTKGYYLCRRDLFGQDTSSRLKTLFGDIVGHPDSQGWKKTWHSITRSYIPDMVIYDVFLCYQGEDTCHAFMDHLQHALVEAGLRTFSADHDNKKGEKLRSQIKTAILGSKSSIVVLSENYANFDWSRDELSLILNQRKHDNHFIVPIYYHVKPSDVNNQIESFPVKDPKRPKCFKNKRWKKAVAAAAALRDVAELPAMVLSESRHETNFIKEVVDTICGVPGLRKIVYHQQHPSRLPSLSLFLGTTSNTTPDHQRQRWPARPPNHRRLSLRKQHLNVMSVSAANHLDHLTASGPP